MNVRDIRRERLLDLLAEHGGRKVDLARAIGKAPPQVSQWVNRVRTITEDTARQIERKTGKPAGWLDHPAARLTTGADTSDARRLVAYAPSAASAVWPFSRIDRDAVLRLTRPQVRDLESALLLVAAQLGLDIRARPGP